MTQENTEYSIIINQQLDEIIGKALLALVKYENSIDTIIASAYVIDKFRMARESEKQKQIAKLAKESATSNKAVK